MSDYLPTEVLLEILVRLPAKSLVRFSCVSKSWYFLIFSPDFNFMYTQFTSTINKDKPAQIMIRNYSRTYGKEMFTMHNDDMSFGEFQILDCPFKSTYGYLLDVIGSCNGLVCLTDRNVPMYRGWYATESPIPTPKPIFLWNPSLGISMNLPLIGDAFNRVVLGLGFDSINFDYKVVRIEFCYGAVCEIDIFRLSEDSWRRFGGKRKVGFPSYYDMRSPQAFVNGNINWIGCYIEEDEEEITCKTLIVATFDVGKEVFGDLEVPEELENGGDDEFQLSLVVLHKSLSLIRYEDGEYPCFNRCCIWMMHEYGVAESWTKMYTISPYNGFSRTLNIRTNGELLLVTSNGGLVSFDPESRSIRQLKVYGEQFSFVVGTYMESLVLSEGFSRILLQAAFSKATPHDKARGNYSVIKPSRIKRNRIWKNSNNQRD